MKYDHPTIVVEESPSGYFVIKGHAPKNIVIPDEGTLCPPDTCIIPAEIPAGLLRAIADAKDGKKTVPVAALASEEDEYAEDDAESGEPAEQSAEPSLVERIVNILAEGNIRTGDLADRLGVTAADIKALDGTSPEFHIGNAGWVKLGKKEGEA